MDAEQVQIVGIVVQSATAVIAVAAALVAIFTSAADRKNNREIAQQARNTDIRTRSLLLELEYALQLSINRNHGGSTDALIRKQLGAEALALVALLGKERVPGQWERQVQMDPAGLRELLSDPEYPDFKKDQVEATLAVQQILTEFRGVPGPAAAG